MTYKVHHVFPATGEWAAVELDLFCEAVAWYKRDTGRCVLLTIVTLQDSKGRVYARKERK